MWHKNITFAEFTQSCTNCAISFFKVGLYKGKGESAIKLFEPVWSIGREEKVLPEAKGHFFTSSLLRKQFTDNVLIVKQSLRHYILHEKVSIFLTSGLKPLFCYVQKKTLDLC